MPGPRRIHPYCAHLHVGRRVSGLTQKDVALALSTRGFAVSIRSIGTWELHTVPRADIYAALCDLYRIELGPMRATG